MYTALHMPRLTLQSRAFKQNARSIIWLDVEMRKADVLPALTSVLWPEGLMTYAHDAILAESAEARQLVFLPWKELASQVVQQAMA